MAQHNTLQKNGLEILKLLSSETRLSIIALLMEVKCDICVNEIAEAINMSHSATSHQLSKLERCGIVESRRNGQTMCYTITSSSVAKRAKSIVHALQS